MRKPQPYKQSAEPQPVAQPVQLPDTRRGSPLPWVSVTPGLAYGRYLTDQVEDNARNESNRFQVAATINQTLGADAPLWRRPATRRPPVREEARDLRPTLGMAAARTDSSPCGSSTPRSVSKLAYAGSVGSQALFGIPVVHRLRWHSQLKEGSLVWPFEINRPVHPGRGSYTPRSGPGRFRPGHDAKLRSHRRTKAGIEIGKSHPDWPESIDREAGPLKCCGDVLIDFHDRTASDH